MKLGIMQPYFFPYLSYFSLIKHTDKWVVFNTPQFIRHGWIERNRVLKFKEGWLYIKVLLIKHDRGTAIKDIKIRNDEDWKVKILAQLVPYKKIAPYYFEVIKLIKNVFQLETDSIVDLNIEGLKAVCDYIKIDFNYAVFSDSKIELPDIQEPDEWALEISKALGATDYYNPIGGIEFFDRTKYQKNNINLHFFKTELIEYDQKRKPFERGLSIIDVLMFHSPEKVNSMLDNISIL